MARAAPAPRQDYVTRAQIDAPAQEAAQRAAKKAESEHGAINRLANAIRDVRALGLADGWTIGGPSAAITLELRDLDVARTLNACIFGAD